MPSNVSRQEFESASGSPHERGVQARTAADGSILIRNPLNPEHVLRFSRAEWLSFCEGVKNGEFDIA